MEEIFASLLDWVCLGRTRYSTFLRVYKESWEEVLHFRSKSMKLGRQVTRARLWPFPILRKILHDVSSTSRELH